MFALQACVALGVVAVVRAVDFALRQWSIGLVRSIPDEGAGPELMAQLETADRFIDTNNVAILVTFVVTAVLYLRWLHGIVTLTLALGGALSWRPAQAVWTFFIPFANFAMIYTVMRQIWIGSHDPVASNDSPENKQKNRRVDIFVADAEAGAQK